MVKKPLALAIALALSPCFAQADEVSDLKAQVEALQKQIDALKGKIEQVTTQVQSQKTEMQAQQAEQQKKNEQFLARQPGATGLTFLTPGGGDVTLYGNLDLSFDYATKGLLSDYGDNGGMPVGQMGWQPAISTNLSYIGVRGRHPLQENLDFVWQLEAGIAISALPGTVNTTSNNSDQVNGALFSRNSFIGFAGKDWGAVKIGKSETPYKLSTDPLNPFSGMLGDYRVIMGNTGGDNRVEFGYRAPHAIWYESPSWSGVSFNAMYAPGQNRDDTSSIVPSGEPDCSGGNIPGSGALPPTCNDGSFGNLYSVSLLYRGGPLYLATAYELHKNVNRTSDLPVYDPNDIADESAYKAAIQYAFPTKTVVGFEWERTKRNVPADLQYQNERTRNNATWLVVTQALTEKDNVSFGWAHAGSTPGDPGQHNTSGGPNPPNSANMYTLAWKHAVDSALNLYANYAATINNSSAHYDLGAGGHAATVDCHDSTPEAAFDATTGTTSNTGPHCFAGGHLQGISVGAQYRF
ncbi:MAG TPA: porin [Casimicrobiaceae bacterium]